MALLTEFKKVFAWLYEDMPGIDTDIVQHCIPTDPTMKPIKQKLRRMKLEWTLKIKEEVDRQYNAGFLRVVNYPKWLANVVSVPKKDGKVRMCVEFRDLSKASRKDDFPLPHIDILVDNTAGHALLSFMDGLSGYNQIKWLYKIWRKPPLLHHGGHIATRSCHLALKMLVLLTNVQPPLCCRT